MKHHRLALAAAALTLLGACGGQGADTHETTPTTEAAVVTQAAPTTDAPTPTTEPAPPPTTEVPTTEAPAAAATPVARSTAAVAVFASPTDTEPVLVLPATTEFGSPRALAVVGAEGDRLLVRLPVRPNGSTGWIDAAAVELVETTHRIVVDLGLRTLQLLDGGDVVLETPVAVGTPENPTPTGEFFLTDLLATGDETSAYGPYAAGTSGHSHQLTEFAGGDGQIGIHGTNDPSSIGQAASHGCIRVPNDVMVQIVEQVSLGTPVSIVAGPA